jgi:hypothetical protein
MHPKNIKAPAHVTYGTCDKCGQESPLCARVIWLRKPLMACSTCRLEGLGKWYTAPGWDDGIPREHEPSLGTETFAEWAAANPPLDDLDDEPEVDCCVHGHPWTEENTRINRNGTRACRTCQRARDRLRNREAARTLDSEYEGERCTRGHPWTPANTRTKADGRRICRACHRERERERDRTKERTV